MDELETKPEVNMSLDDLIASNRNKGRNPIEQGEIVIKNTRRPFQRSNNRAFKGNNNDRFQQQNNFNNRAFINDYKPNVKRHLNERVKEVKKVSGDGKRIYISNLAKEIQVDELLVLFNQFGDIKNLEIRWRARKSNRCSAMIEYGTKEEARKAKEEYDGAE